MGVGTSRILAATCVLAALAGCAVTPSISLPWEPSELDVPLDRPIIARINGRGPYSLGFDSGQSLALLLSPALAQSLKLPVIQTASASDGSSRNAKSVEIVRVEQLSVRNAEFMGAPAVVLDNSTTVSETHGSLGFPLFSDRLLTLDYPGRRLRTSPGTLPPVDGREILPLRLADGLPIIPIAVGPLTVEALVDSGSDGELILPLSLAAKLPLESPPRPAGRMATLFNIVHLFKARLAGDVRIGSHEIHRPMLTFADHFEQANLGRGLLKLFRVTLDQTSGRVRFERGPG
jgi:predicted aspartyl protease